MKVVVLAGGAGTRLQEYTTVVPKPMVEIGGKPILWHIMKIYSKFSFNEFVVALGYKGAIIKQYFIDYHNTGSDLTIHLATGAMEAHNRILEDWTVHLYDTGIETGTGGRLRRLRRLLGNQTFMMTYGDGVADIDIGALVEFHRRHGKLATITAVRPPAKFGALQVSGSGAVSRFIEKPPDGEGWVNGGFFVLEPEVLDLISSDEESFELVALDRLAKQGELMAFPHPGFWQCMDTVRDVRVLNELWAGGQACWKSW
jgi:glucose-1-phosphate cytidylyltransferase